jgi:hypothetical protein
MKKKIALFAALVISLTGLLISPASAATPTYTKKDYTFVRLVREDAPVFYQIPAKLMIKTAHSSCDMLDTGVAETEAAWMMVDAGFTKHQAIVFTAAAITVYCPWHGGDNTRTRG